VPSDDRTSALSQTIRAQMQQSGISYTDAQLNDKIQSIVKQMMQDQRGIMPVSAEGSAKIEGAVSSDILQYSEEERKARAKVLINIARAHHDK
jgi:hypothetical protein